MISFNFKNLPHALATFFKTAAADVKKAIPVIENAIEKVEGEKTVIEGVSGAVANAIAPGARRSGHHHRGRRFRGARFH